MQRLMRQPWVGDGRTAALASAGGEAESPAMLAGAAAALELPEQTPTREVMPVGVGLVRVQLERVVADVKDPTVGPEGFVSERGSRFAAHVVVELAAAP